MPDGRSLPRQHWHLRGRRLAAWLGVLALCLRLLLPALHDHAAHGHGTWRSGGTEVAVVAACSCGHQHGTTSRGDGGAPAAVQRAEVQQAELPPHACLACDFEAFAPVGAAPASQPAVPPTLPVAEVRQPRPAAHHGEASPAAVGRGPPNGALSMPRTLPT